MSGISKYSALFRSDTVSELMGCISNCCLFINSNVPYYE
jgi:hypothetical protein